VIKTLEEHKIDLMGLNVTDKNIAFFVKKEKLDTPKLIDTIHQYGQTSTLINQSLISIIGNELNQKKISEIVKDQINITSIIHTASENSITMVCHSSDAKEIINSLHDKHCVHGVNS
jgi:aspartokinase